MRLPEHDKFEGELAPISPLCGKINHSHTNMSQLEQCYLGRPAIIKKWTARSMLSILVRVFNE